MEQTPEYGKALQILYNWKKKNYITATSGNVDDVYTMAVSDKYASFVDRVGSSEQVNKILSANGGRPWKFVECDRFPESISDRYFNPERYICINAKSPNAERAVMFIEWLMYYQEYYDLLMFGIKDKDYKTSDSGMLKVIPPSENVGGELAYAEEHKLWSFKNDFREHLSTRYITDYKKIWTNFQNTLCIQDLADIFLILIGMMK